MKLSRIISSVASARVNGLPSVAGQDADPEISSIQYRSDRVTAGSMFVAIQGTHVDGHRFVQDAVARGASAVVIESPHPYQPMTGGAVAVSVDNTRKALASMAAQFYNNPSDKLYLIGITGTNGKTTTAYLIERLLLSQGIDAGVISTINYRYRGRVFENPLTTPESLDLQKILWEMAGAGVTHVVMEVSSHGVALDRIYSCRFDMGIFTNLTQDHLDFHGTMADYWACKKRFFTEYLACGPKSSHATAVINHHDEKGRELLGSLKDMRLIAVGAHPSNAVAADGVVFDEYGMKGKILFGHDAARFQSPLVGRYNLENILCAAGAGMAMGMTSYEIVKGMASFGGVPGRLERIPSRSDRHIYIDYAHTPDALLNVLTTLREIITGRLICVFGCGGDRDRKKRPQMGEIAARLSDLAIITSDNPRTESPDAIINDIRPGVTSVLNREYALPELESGFDKRGFAVQPDREKAIFLGIRAVRNGDAVLIAGKGHEDYQIVGQKTFHFDDREKALAALTLVEKGDN
ncbi:MAG: UDP-N-acetylmuramoyl-L-alanyl-D-glutamate--2,6-diaminopimelate ligase [Desulfosalsimonadaceae bacterium]